MSRSTPEITVAQLDDVMQTGGTLVDVREAVLMPMGQLPSRVGDLDKGEPVYVVCASGNRSAAMRDFLNAAGFRAFSVADGTSGWARSGRDVVTGARPV